MGVTYYHKIRIAGGSSIVNPEVIDLLLLMRWHGEKPSYKKHLEVIYPSVVSPSCNHRKARFWKITCDDIDDSDSAPFRRARLRMEGSADGVPEVYALLENVNIDNVNDGNSTITFAPVPFGAGGKPLLPYKDKELSDFLTVAREVLLGSDWNPEKLFTEIKRISHLFVTEKTRASWAVWFLEQFDYLGVTKRDGDNTHWVIMAPQEFENIFGVKLPN